MKLKFNALVLAAAMIAAPAFAAGGSDFDSSVNFSDITAIDDAAISAELNEALGDVFDPSVGVYAQSVGLIAQIGDGNFALVDQQGGEGNYVGIMQDSSTIANVAVVSQNGNYNRSFVNQH